MHKTALVAWSQFETMMRMGVPHAMDIAEELMRHNLEFPLPTCLAKETIDLQFYCVVHRAYRSGTLPQFLGVMQRLKQTELWTGIQSTQSTQMRIAEFCQEFNQLPSAELATRIETCLAETKRCARSVARSCSPRKD